MRVRVRMRVAVRMRAVIEPASRGQHVPLARRGLGARLVDVVRAMVEVVKGRRRDEAEDERRQAEPQNTVGAPKARERAIALAITMGAAPWVVCLQGEGTQHGPVNGRSDDSGHLITPAVEGEEARSPHHARTGYADLRCSSGTAPGSAVTMTGEMRAASAFMARWNPMHTPAPSPARLRLRLGAGASGFVTSISSTVGLDSRPLRAWLSTGLSRPPSARAHASVPSQSTSITARAVPLPAGALPGPLCVCQSIVVPDQRTHVHIAIQGENAWWGWASVGQGFRGHKRRCGPRLPAPGA